MDIFAAGHGHIDILAVFGEKKQKKKKHHIDRKKNITLTGAISFSVRNTLKCLNIGTPKTINFPFVANGKLMIFRCPNI